MDYFKVSSARFNFNTFTPVSPKMPKSGFAVLAVMSSLTFSTLRLRALATRAVCSSAF
jgi:hypothetical protein